jgi:hypothetical protein
MARTLVRFPHSLGWVIAIVAATSSQGRADVPQPKFLAGDGTSEDRFGYSVALSGDTALVGAPGDNPQGSLSGSTYVFVRGSSGWVQQAKLVASDGATKAGFGRAVALNGDTAVIGAPNAAITGTDTGAVYVFVRSGTTWTQQAKLSALDYVVFDGFGSSVSVMGDTAAIGSPYADPFGENSGAAYVFARTGTTWSQQTKIVPIDGRSLDLFGSSVALSSDTLVGGAPGDDDNAVASGSAYVFLRSGANWGLQQKIRPADGANGDSFGSAVTISGNTVAVGSPDDDERGLASGSAYVYVRNSGLWSPQAKLFAVGSEAGDFFGASLALSGDNLLVGSFLDDVRTVDSGSAYAFQRTGATWIELHKFAPATSVASDNFGVAVALDGNQGLVGAEQDDSLGSNSGAAFPLLFTGAPAPALGRYAWLMAAGLAMIGALLVRKKSAIAR